MDETYDFIIIGGGTAGLIAAGFAVQLGVRVALVERDRIGGDCTWTGCVPSKTLLKTAKVAHQMRTADRYGLSPAKPNVDLKAVMAHVQDVIAEIYQQESPDALRADGIDVFLGPTHFRDSHSLTVGGTTLKGRHFLIATGAHPFVPPITGLDKVDYLTYQDIWNLETLPQHLLVVGAGPVGCELSQAFRRLGSRVTLIASRDQLLPRDEPAASRVLGQVFAAEGIEIRYNTRAERVWQAEDGIHLGTGGVELTGDALLVAAGRRPNVEGLDLKQAAVAYTPQGIQVDDHLRTSQRHIYAAGDCIGSYQYTHYAGWQAFMAARNALLPGASKAVAGRVPWTTFTDPEVAHAGFTEEQARDRFGPDVLTCDWPMDQVDRAQTEANTAGFIKLLHRRNGTLLGVTIVATVAGEMIHEWIVALERGVKVGDLASVIHVYPTYSTASMQVAAHIRVSQLLSGTPGRIVRRLARLMR